MNVKKVSKNKVVSVVDAAGVPTWEHEQKDVRKTK